MAEPQTPEQAAASAQLTAAGQAGYDSFPRDCSHSVWMVLQRMISPDEPYRTANALIDHVRAPGNGWHEVTLQDAAERANRGQLVIGGLAKPGGNGHVVVVMPGPPHASGGFPMANGRTMPSAGPFPPSMSGSMSNWPGARSRGEKTVRDPWNDRDWSQVRFWAHD